MPTIIIVCYMLGVTVLRTPNKRHYLQFDSLMQGKNGFKLI